MADEPLRFTKGHGTRNDFVLFADPEGAVDLEPELVRALADRRGGVGGDGVIRAVRTAVAGLDPDLAAAVAGTEWFMDYRNADGSTAEMCGNGVRVFAAFLLAEHLAELAEGEVLLVGTRAGVKPVRREGEWFAVDMGPWRLPGGAEAAERGVDAEVAVAGLGTRPALSVEVGNPHTVLALAEPAELDGADLSGAPDVRPVPPEGTNVELALPLGEATMPDGRRAGRLRMRVHERGVGETASCGTGACAAALAVRTWAGDGAPDVWWVEVPGGELRVSLLPGGNVELAGPAVLVAEGVAFARGAAAVQPRG